VLICPRVDQAALNGHQECHRSDENNDETAGGTERQRVRHSAHGRIEANGRREREHEQCRLDAVDAAQRAGEIEDN
jgi:hypothetical protein